jgi:hypothetical protein
LKAEINTIKGGGEKLYLLLQLRQLQTLAEIAAEKNSTIILK